MKSFLPVALAPVVLTGCALNTQTPPTVPAQQFVTTLIQEQLPLIQQPQAELAKASRVHLSPGMPLPLPASSKVPAARNATETPALAGRGWSDRSPETRPSHQINKSAGTSKRVASALMCCTVNARRPLRMLLTLLLDPNSSSRSAAFKPC
jgi:hypothetical protein